MSQVFKFISLPNEFLTGVGIGNHHIHLLKQNLGIDYFPPETLAIGTGLIEENGYVDKITFDYGDGGGKQHAMDQLQGWALENGYILGSHIHDIYKHSAESWTKQRVPHELGDSVAFIWLDGKLHLGTSHPAILLGLYGDAGHWDDWSDAFTGQMIAGYVYPQEGAVDIFSDFYHQNYNEDNVRNLLEQLRTRWTITQVTYGPDAETIAEMEKAFDPRSSRLAYIDKTLKI